MNMLQKLTTQYSWKGILQKPPSVSFIQDALHSHSYLYSGHGSGSKYYSYETMMEEKESISAISLLMGCSSVRMGSRGSFVQLGAPLYYQLNKAPFVIGCLWDVSDGDLDRMTKFILTSIMESKEEVELGDIVKEARNVCLLHTLVGSAMVCYGLPIHVKMTVNTNTIL